MEQQQPKLKKSSSNIIYIQDDEDSFLDKDYGYYIDLETNEYLNPNEKRFMSVIESLEHRNQWIMTKKRQKTLYKNSEKSKKMKNDNSCSSNSSTSSASELDIKLDINLLFEKTTSFVFFGIMSLVSFGLFKISSFTKK